MCGLFGWQWAQGKRPNKQQRHRLASALATANDKRGGQAWGIWSPVVVMRGLGKAADNAHRFSNLEAVFGHCRWATHGANVIANAHPFEQGGTYLSHNGVISNHSALNSQYQRRFDVDSQHLLAHLVEGKPFSEIHAYGAITWAKSSDTKRIYMGRLNARGQLSVFRTTLGVVWSSEESALKQALAEAGIETEIRYEVEPGKAFFAEDGVLYEADEHPEIKVGEPPSPIRDWRSFGNYESNYGSSWVTTNTSYTQYWCNKHKNRWSHCPCPASAKGDPHIVAIPAGATPIVGTALEVAVNDPKASAGTTSASTGTTGNGPVTEHDTYMAWVNGRKNNPGATPHLYFCPALNCFERYPCAAHPNNANAPTPPSAHLPLLAPPPSPMPAPGENDEAAWNQYLKDAAAAAEAEENAQLKADIIEELAESFLVEEGFGERAFDGYDGKALVELAEDFGFDPEKAWKDLMWLGRT